MMRVINFQLEQETSQPIQTTPLVIMLSFLLCRWTWVVASSRFGDFTSWILPQGWSLWMVLGWCPVIMFMLNQSVSIIEDFRLPYWHLIIFNRAIWQFCLLGEEWWRLSSQLSLPITLEHPADHCPSHLAISGGCQCWFTVGTPGPSHLPSAPVKSFLFFTHFLLFQGYLASPFSLP